MKGLSFGGLSRDHASSERSVTNLPSHPQPEPTESEAIVAALRAPADPGTPLVAAVPLPVDVAGDLPLPTAQAKPIAPGKVYGNREGQVERRHPDPDAKPPLVERRKDDHAGGED